eukprot:257193-Hanusia_phi.AAC.2
MMASESRPGMAVQPESKWHWKSEQTATANPPQNIARGKQRQQANAPPGRQRKPAERIYLLLCCAA